MCGIFGLVAKSGAMTAEEYKKVLDRLFILSESRGKESAGIAIRSTVDSTISVLKKDIRATELIKTAGYRKTLDASLKNEALPAAIAHSRLVTDGVSANNDNNQPVYRDEMVLVHNGIICNYRELWAQHRDDMQPRTEVDSEVLPALIRHALEANGSIFQALNETFTQIEGAASIATFLADRPVMALATNTGSLYYSSSESDDVFVFASESYILDQTINQTCLARLGMAPVTWLAPRNALLVETNTLAISTSALDIDQEWAPAPAKIDVYSIGAVEESSSQPRRTQAAPVGTACSEEEKNLVFDEQSLRSLKRCSKCVLPDSFPFITFDEAGVCNYCRNYKPKVMKGGMDELSRIIDSYRGSGDHFCIAAFSGGRDSSFGLHKLKTELDVSPLTFTYDWGMVTDLARRNIARVTGKLGLENILVSADISRKRDNVRRNIEAWLRRPDLGIIPLFMAGDKHFFKWMNVLKRQNGVTLNIWMPNQLENTDFKTGFCGVRPDFDKDGVDSLSTFGKMRMPLHYLGEFLRNPSYLNRSVWDTLSAYQSYYFEPREGFLSLYDYVDWDETTIEETLQAEYNWETSPDTDSTWRIGDGTAAFYNYVYMTIAGFSEVDTFRSNQIREGQVDRSEALEMVMQENRPRYASIKWYLDVLGLDFGPVVEKINQAPKVYAIPG